MAYVLKINDRRNVETLVGTLKRYFKKHDMDGEVHYSGDMVAVGIRNLRRDFTETPLEIAHKNALFWENMQIGCSVIDYGEFERLKEFLEKHHFRTKK